MEKEAKKELVIRKKLQKKKVKCKGKYRFWLAHTIINTM
jgi:hypothetical protein